ncbi:hypothetical protein AUC61_05860 [Pseudomonas sp. S25]|uniref:Uncharacterized protein n=1 Tax=Pseudomonas maioricensis TaxID=1766623 RepID=A0ABS9ZER9_9PSED|nr:hypothetical protein [Pseudomonas sp. S25]MCI8209059.1 hypothetical protein [Pseudomonas sp. S25]
MTVQAPEDSVGADEHREAAIAVDQVDRYRSLAVLVSAYREKHSGSGGCVLFEEKPPCRLP